MPKTETKSVIINPHHALGRRKMAKMLSDGWEIVSQSKPLLTSNITYVFARPKKSLLERLTDTDTSSAGE